MLDQDNIDKKVWSVKKFPKSPKICKSISSECLSNLQKYTSIVFEEKKEIFKGACLSKGHIIMITTFNGPFNVKLDKTGIFFLIGLASENLNYKLYIMF